MTPHIDDKSKQVDCAKSTIAKKKCPIVFLIVVGLAAAVAFVIYKTPRSSLPTYADTVARLTAMPRLPITIIVIDHNAPRSIAATLKSYKDFDLLSLVNESVFFAQEIHKYDRQSFMLSAGMQFSRVVGSTSNLYVHGAILEAVTASTSDYILLLEKDFQLIKDPRAFLVEALALMQRDTNIKVVRTKSRTRPGVPEFARLEYHYREEDILDPTTNVTDLKCQLLYWLGDSYVSASVSDLDMWKCTDNPGFWCSNTRSCHWTNQAPLFKRSWFMKYMKSGIAALGTNQIDEYQRHHALEIAMRYETHGLSWNSKPWVVAIGDGIFSHRDMDKYAYDTRMEDNETAFEEFRSKSEK
jgi:hypothetical protein